MAGQRLLQNLFELHRHAGIKRLFANQRIQRPLLAKLPQQIGQTSAQRHFATKELHPVARARLEGQLIAGKALAHLGHIALQRGPADKPLIGQILKLEGKGRGEKPHQ